MQLLKKLPYFGVIALLVYMPLHVFLSQSLSLVTGGLEVWKIGKDVLVAALAVFAVCLVFWQRRAERWYCLLVGLATAYTLAHVFVWLVAGREVYAESVQVGSIYNLRLLCYVLLGASTALLLPKVFVFRSISKIIIGVSTVVALFGVLQYFLPKDFLTHFGYSLERGVRPMFFIDDNPAFPRIMSTLRDPNSLGAYLLVPLSLLTVYALRLKAYATRQRLLLLGVYALHFAALYLTFSRSAWLAGGVLLGLTVWWRLSSQFVHMAREYWPVVVVLMVVVASGLFMLRSNTHIDGVLTHSTEAQVGDTSSNEYHWLYVTRGIEGIRDKPFGHGPGSAGLASIQDPSGRGLLTENYYVQIGYEVGVLGLLIFIAVHVLVYVRIWRRHDEWTAVLLATFWAYVITNMLLHTWSNEAVAAQWWLLVGVALASGKFPKEPAKTP